MNNPESDLEMSVPTQRELSEREYFMIEAAYHHGFKPIDDDATIYAATQEQIVALLQNYQSPDDRTLSDLKINDFIDAQVKRAYFVPSEADTEPRYMVTTADATRIAQEAALQVIMDKRAFLDNLAVSVHELNVRAGWWNDLETGADLHGKRNYGELLALVHSEISEALEAKRKNLMDDKLPHRPGHRVELIDALIRILDLLGSEREAQRDHPAGTIFMEKLAYNQRRDDHKPENRRKADGKKI